MSPAAPALAGSSLPLSHLGSGQRPVDRGWRCERPAAHPLQQLSNHIVNSFEAEM